MRSKPAGTERWGPYKLAWAADLDVAKVEAVQALLERQGIQWTSIFLRVVLRSQVFANASHFLRFVPPEISLACGSKPGQAGRPVLPEWLP